MSPTAAEILDRHVTLALESIDRLDLNGYLGTAQEQQEQQEQMRTIRTEKRRNPREDQNGAA